MPNLETLITCSYKEGIDVWNLITGSLVRSIHVPTHASVQLCLIDTEHLAVCQYDRAILYVINYKTGSIRTRSPIAENVKHLNVSHDGAYLVGGAASGKVYVWQVATGELVRAFDAHYKAVTCLAFSDDDTFLFTGGDDGILNCWIFADVIDAELALKQPHKVTPFAEFSNHSLSLTSIQCGADVSGGGKLITSSLDRTVKVYSLAAKCVLQSITFPAPINCLVMDPSETTIMAACTDHNVYKYSFYGGGGSSTSTGTTSESTSAGAAGASNTTSTGAVATASSKPVVGNSDMRVLRGHRAEVTGLSLSLNGSLLATSSLDGTVKLWDVPNNQLIKSMTAGRASFGGAKIVTDHYAALNLRGTLTPPAMFSKYVLETAPLTEPLDVSLGPNINNLHQSRGRFATVGFSSVAGLVTGGGLDSTLQESVLSGSLSGLAGSSSMGTATLDRTHIAASIGAGMITDASLMTRGSTLGSAVQSQRVAKSTRSKSSVETKEASPDSDPAELDAMTGSTTTSATSKVKSAKKAGTQPGTGKPSTATTGLKKVKLAKE